MVIKSEAALRIEIGLRLTRAMAKADLDRTELSRLTGFAEDQIEGWELGLEPLYPDELISLCHFLGVTPNHLFGLDGN
jgi:hypothetical protein